MAEVIRFQAEIEQAQLNVLEEVRNVCDFRTNRDLLNNALSLIVWIVREIRLGRTILSVDERTGAQKELSMPFFDTIRQKAQDDDGSIAPVGAGGSRRQLAVAGPGRR